MADPGVAAKDRREISIPERSKMASGLSADLIGRKAFAR
jgi:hypothetical protein